MFDLEKIRKVSNEWRSEVVDFTRRNTLLVFKSGPATIPVSLAAESSIDLLLNGGTTGLSSLLHPETSLDIANKSADKLNKKQNYFLEELGVSPINLAIGLAKWDEPALPDDDNKSKMTNAPVFLLPLEIEKSKLGSDIWKLRATQDLKINGVLVHAAESAGIKFNEDEFLESLSEQVSLEILVAKLEDVKNRLKGLRDFSIDISIHLAAFSYQDEAIYRDLADVEAILASDVARALAGDAEAILKLQDIKEVQIDAPDRLAPSLENLILDADSSQIEAINSALAGNTLVIEGPPGTGKSQTISNLLAECLAQNKRVLFVAQKRAAIDAVLKRLSEKGLDALVLDVHEASRGPQVAAQLADSYSNMRQTPPVDLSKVHEELVVSRDKLVGMRDAFVAELRGLGLNLAELRSLYYSIPTEFFPDWQIKADLLSRLSTEDHRAVKTAITAVAESGGFSERFETSSESWNVNLVRTRSDLTALIEESRLFESFTLGKIEELAGGRVSSSASISDLVREARRVALGGWLDSIAPKLVKKARSPRLLVSMRLARGLNVDESLTWTEKLKGSISSSYLLPKNPELAREVLALHLELQSLGDPVQAVLDAARLNHQDWQESLAITAQAIRLTRSVQGLELETISASDFSTHLNGLSKDARQFKIATYWENFDFLASKGLEGLIPDLRAHGAKRGLKVDDFERVFDAAASKSLIESALSYDPRLQGADSQTIERVSKRFKASDKKHIEQNSLKIKRIAATNFKNAVDSHPLESVFLEGEARKKRAHKPLRTLITKAPNLMFAAKPIWAMSPIQVASYLPRRQMFDLVIFDEASQVKPEMAIPAVIRGETLVVAGDSNQLPPTNFFSGGGLEYLGEDLADDELESTTRDSESILEAMERVIGSKKRRLLWHYRSRDERLIALSNIEIYGNSLTTFPASDSHDAVEHVLVLKGKHQPVASESQNDEVAKVLDLIKLHVLQRPEESLGVITFGTSHLQKLEIAIQRERSSNAELDNWIEGQVTEPFFLKNLERVQGDERDAIIISTGYGKDANGKMNLRWGPLNSENGRRRLNVAITRAKRRMTLVTNFSLAELSNQNVRSGTGVELFKKFLDYMGNKGAEYQHASSLIPMNPFELDIKRKLEAQGMSLVSQFGVGGYRIDFAVRDPRDPDKFVLAIEADGASYHSSHIARERDRLRQMLLESRGWNFHRIWSTDWFRDPDSEVSRVLESYSAAISGSFPTESNDTSADHPKVLERTPPRRTLEKPECWGETIDDYTPAQLDRVILFIQSDGLLRENQEIMREAREILGFSRDGSRIRAALESSIKRVNSRS
jgi:superfamily I DNA and/or RNA helicase/very-short-patch-repair endonuclease